MWKARGVLIRRFGRQFCALWAEILYEAKYLSWDGTWVETMASRIGQKTANRICPLRLAMGTPLFQPRYHVSSGTLPCTVIKQKHVCPYNGITMTGKCEKKLSAFDKMTSVITFSQKLSTVCYILCNGQLYYPTHLSVWGAIYRVRFCASAVCFACILLWKIPTGKRRNYYFSWWK